MHPEQIDLQKEAIEGAEAVRNAFGEKSPTTAVILGSGLSAIADGFIEYEIPYTQIPGMPQSGVAGHAGVLRLGRREDSQTLFFCGRSHFYEGFPMSRLGMSVRIAYELGVRTVVSCCAVGSLRKEIEPGTIVAVRDHINTIGINPLRGTIPPEGRPYFIDPSTTYDTALIQQIENSAADAKCPVDSGVYAWVSGPTYETPAESKMLARLGGDVVGMSLVPESLTARQLDMKAVGLACVTNYAPGVGSEPSDHDDVLAVAEGFIEPLRTMIAKMQINMH